MGFRRSPGPPGRAPPAGGRRPGTSVAPRSPRASSLRAWSTLAVSCSTCAPSLSASSRFGPRSERPEGDRGRGDDQDRDDRAGRGLHQLAPLRRASAAPTEPDSRRRRSPPRIRSRSLRRRLPRCRRRASGATFAAFARRHRRRVERARPSGTGPSCRLLPQVGGARRVAARRRRSATIPARRPGSRRRCPSAPRRSRRPRPGSPAQPTSSSAGPAIWPRIAMPEPPAEVTSGEALPLRLVELDVGGEHQGEFVASPAPSRSGCRRGW